MKRPGELSHFSALFAAVACCAALAPGCSHLSRGPADDGDELVSCAMRNSSGAIFEARGLSPERTRRAVAANCIERSSESECAHASYCKPMNEPGERGRVGCTIVTPATETRLSMPYRGFGHSPELGIEAAHWFCIHSQSAQVCEQAVSQGCVIEDDRGTGATDGA